MTHSRPESNKAAPRRRNAATSAIVAGILVVVVATVAVFASEIQDAASSVLNTDDGAVAIDPTPDPSIEAPNADHHYSSAYVEGDVGFPETLNPLLAQTPSEKSASTMLYRTLLTSDSSGDPAPDLAVNWTVSADGTTYTIELDPDAEWHDGEQVKVEDVLFTISLVRDAEFPGNRDLAQFWRAITPQRLDERTIEFSLLEPYVGFAHYLRLPILPKHVFGDVLPSDLDDLPLNQHVVGSGPYAISEIDAQAREIRFVAFENSGDPGFEEVIFRYFDDRDDVIDAFRDGDLDGVSYVPLDRLRDDSALPGNTRVYGPEIAGYTAMYFNVRHPYFRDLNTRRALESAIDRDEIVETVLDGHAVPGDSPIPRMSSAHAPGAHLRYDPSEAEALLEREGWVVEDDDQIRQRDGEYFHIPLIVNSEDPQRIAVANLIQEQLRDVGVSVDVQVMPNSDVQQALASRQFTAVVFGWHTENGNLDCFQLWHSSQGETGTNFTGFADSAADDLLVQARRSASISERNEHYAGFQEIFAEQVPAVVLFYPRYHFAVSERVQGAEPAPLVSPGDRVRQIPKWYAGES